MNTTEEMFDVVDDQDRVIGSATRREVHARGLKHRAVHILLFNTRGEVFVQKRSATKDRFPGRYDSSASGHVDAGEEYDVAAVRELREELGLELPAIRRLVKITACDETDNEFVWVYSLRGDYQPQINREEIESGEYQTWADIHAGMAAHPERYAPSFIKVFDEVQRFV